MSTAFSDLLSIGLNVQSKCQLACGFFHGRVIYVSLYCDQTNSGAHPGSFKMHFFSGLNRLQHENNYHFCIMARLRMHGVCLPYIFMARIETRSRHYRCLDKEILRILSVCLQHQLSSMRSSIVICSLSDYTEFFHIISYRVRFSEKKILDVKCVFRFSLQLLSKTFLILRRIEGDIIINGHRPSCKYPPFQ